MKNIKNIKEIALFITYILICNFIVQSQDPEIECVVCANNKVEFEIFASAIGEKNISIGKSSFAGGSISEARGDYSLGFGYGSLSHGLNSVALGSESKALNTYSIAIGRHAYSTNINAISIGKYTEASGISSFSIGTFLKNNAGFSFIIGKGASNSQRLENNKSNSLIVGFNSTLPTLFVGPSAGSNYTGKVGIGNITDPEAKLHIKSDINEDASILLQSVGSNYTSKILFGDENHLIYGKTGENLTFQTETNKYFVFENGKVGIGTDTPSHLLEINGDFFVNSTSSLLGNVGIGTTTIPVEKLEVNGNIFQSPGFIIATNHIKAADTNGLFLTDMGGNGIYIDNRGNVGVGTTEPGDYKLAVDGKIQAEELKIVVSVPSSDYVFEKDYKLITITDLENFITENKHLPQVPSAKEFEANGYNVGEMDNLLLKKIEELTLYIIQQQKEIEKLKSEMIYSNSE